MLVQIRREEGEQSRESLPAMQQRSFENALQSGGGRFTWSCVRVEIEFWQRPVWCSEALAWILVSPSIGGWAGHWIQRVEKVWLPDVDGRRTIPNVVWNIRATRLHTAQCRFDTPVCIFHSFRKQIATCHVTTGWAVMKLIWHIDILQESNFKYH